MIDSRRYVQGLKRFAIVLALLALGLTGCAKKYVSIGLGTNSNPVVLEVLQNGQVVDRMDQSKTHSSLKPGEYCFRAYDVNDPVRMPLAVPGCVDSSTPFQVYLHDGSDIKFTN